MSSNIHNCNLCRSGPYFLALGLGKKMKRGGEAEGEGRAKVSWKSIGQVISYYLIGQRFNPCISVYTKPGC